MTTVGSWLTAATKLLQQAGIMTARLDALVLLEDQLNKNRAHLLAHPETVVSPKNIKVLDQKISQRVTHIPIAYLLGRTEFYGRDFIITSAVLEPRPESETMIDLLKEHTDPTKGLKLPHTLSSGEDHFLHDARVADVGTGSGALGITAQLEVPSLVVDLIELDKKALEIAKRNVVLHTINISVIESNLLTNTPQNYDVLLCNLPYVPDDFQINPAAMREPRIAIFGGPDGLDVYRKLFADLPYLQHKPLYILTESLPPQHEMLRDIARTCDYALLKEQDFIQVFVREIA